MTSRLLGEKSGLFSSDSRFRLAANGGGSQRLHRTHTHTHTDGLKKKRKWHNLLVSKVKCQTWGHWPAAGRQQRNTQSEQIPPSTQTWICVLLLVHVNQSWWQTLRPPRVRGWICCYLLWFRASWERAEDGATQAGIRHPSPQEIKVNNRDLTSCSSNLIMLWSESLQLPVWGSKCVSAQRRRRRRRSARSNASDGIVHYNSLIFLCIHVMWQHLNRWIIWWIMSSVCDLWIFLIVFKYVS